MGLVKEKNTYFITTNKGGLEEEYENIIKQLNSKDIKFQLLEPDIDVLKVFTQDKKEIAIPAQIWCTDFINFFKIIYEEHKNNKNIEQIISMYKNNLIRLNSPQKDFYKQNKQIEIQNKKVENLKINLE